MRRICENSKDQLFKRSLASVKQNHILSNFQFAKCFYLNTIYHEKVHESIRCRLEKHLFFLDYPLRKMYGGPKINFAKPRHKLDFV